MSRILLLLFASGTAQPADVTAETALVRYREKTSVVQPRCKRSPDSQDIVVCAESNAKHRLPLPDERGPPEGLRLASGNIPSASARRVYTGGCGTIQGERMCGGGISILSAVPLLFKGIKKLADPDGDIEPPPEIPDSVRMHP